MVRRAICYDVTHLVSRLGVQTPSGIDQVDLAYGRHFVERGLGPFVHYGLFRPHVFAEARASNLLDLYRTPTWVRSDGPDPEFDRICAVLTAAEPPQARPRSTTAPWISRLKFSANRVRFRLAADLARVPEGAVYLNVAQHGFEYPHFFRWLARRRDVKSVFLIHDLLPLDYPEYFRRGYKARFGKRLTTALTYAHGFIVTSQVVATRLAEEISSRGLRQRPILVAPLPSSLPDRSDVPHGADSALAALPYFVTLGTIEPRKNHLLLLSVWRDLANEGKRSGRPVPKLVLVGGRGWENEQVIDILDRGQATRPHIFETRGLSPAGLVRLLANARALLMPSWSEGYGIPLVEALTMSTPVVASDAPVFREVTQGCATFLSPIDGLGWRDAIVRLSAATGLETTRTADAPARGFVPPRWPAYFGAVETFLGSL